jgi:hypothetical protein
MITKSSMPILILLCLGPAAVIAQQWEYDSTLWFVGDTEPDVDPMGRWGYIVTTDADLPEDAAARGMHRLEVDAWIDSTTHVLIDKYVSFGHQRLYFWNDGGTGQASPGGKATVTGAGHVFASARGFIGDPPGPLPPLPPYGAVNGTAWMTVNSLVFHEGIMTVEADSANYNGPETYFPDDRDSDDRSVHAVDVPYPISLELTQSANISTRLSGRGLIDGNGHATFHLSAAGTDPPYGPGEP